MRYKRTITISLVLLFFVLLQSTFLKSFRIFGTVPDLVVLFVAMLGLFNGIWEGALFGVFSGIILGFFSSGSSAVFCISYGLTGFVSGVVRERIHPDHFIIPSITGVLLTLLCSALIVLLSVLLGNLKNFEGFYAHAMTLLLINGALSIPIGYLVRSRYITSKRFIHT